MIFREETEYIPSGLKELKIALPEAGIYTVVIVDKWGKRHRVTKATTGNILTIDLIQDIDTPKLLNVYGGVYKLYVEGLEFEGYEGILVECYAVTPLYESYTINLSGGVVEEPEPSNIIGQFVIGSAVIGSSSGGSNVATIGEIIIGEFEIV